MRKTVKLVAASAIAAMALAGSATAASAVGHDKKDDDHSWNVCGNSDGHALVSAKDNGSIDVEDDVEVEDNNNQVNCQNGVNNKSEIEYESYGDGFFEVVGTLVDGTVALPA